MFLCVCVCVLPQMVVESSLIDCGSHVVGQTMTRVITLSNQGALGTHYTLLPASSSNHTQLHSPSHASSSSTKVSSLRDLTL